MKLLNADTSGCSHMYISNVAADTTRLTCHYFIPILQFLYCLDPKLALTAFS